jgi:cation transport ATPase
MSDLALNTPARGYQIVHKIAGRLRIQILRLRDDGAFANKLTWLLESVAGVTSVRINPAAYSLVLTYLPAQIPDATLQAEIEICILKANGTNLDKISSLESLSPDETETELEPEINHWQDLGMPAVSLAIALLAAPLELPVVIVGAAIAGAALPWFIRATDSLVNHHQPNIDLLDSLWMTMQTVQGNYAAPALKTCMVEVRRSLRGTTAASHTQAAQELLTWLEQPIWVERDGQRHCLPVNAIQVGDRVQVQAGERIPVDGWIIQGTAWVDEHPFTEDKTPQRYQSGDPVYAATHVVAGQLTIQTQRSGVNSRMGLVAQLIQEMPVHDTQLGVHQAEFLRAAIFPTILFGGAMFALTGNIGAAISPFQLDFGSGVPISVHTTLLSALTYSARCGIYIRSARTLEALTQLDAVVLDQSSMLDPSLRPNTRSVIAALQNQGVTVYWSTSNPQASDWAAQLGISPNHLCNNTEADRTTHLVASLVAGLRHQGKTVAFMGDSAHPAALEANISIAFAYDQEIAQVTADLVLLEEGLEPLLHAIAIAKRAMTVVYENTAIIVLPNLFIQIGGGMILGINPVINVITNNSSAFVAEFFHATRPLFDQDNPAPVTFRILGGRTPLPIDTSTRKSKIPNDLATAG